MTVIFESLRKPDFVVEGTNDPETAYTILLQQEKDSGNLWKLGDPIRNKKAIENDGFILWKKLAIKVV